MRLQQTYRRDTTTLTVDKVFRLNIALEKICINTGLGEPT